MKELKLTNGEYISLTELATKLNVSKEVLKRLVNDLYPRKIKKGVKTYLNDIEATAVKFEVEE